MFFGSLHMKVFQSKAKKPRCALPKLRPLSFVHAIAWCFVMWPSLVFSTKEDKCSVLSSTVVAVGTMGLKWLRCFDVINDRCWIIHCCSGSWLRCFDVKHHFISDRCWAIHCCSVSSRFVVGFTSVNGCVSWMVVFHERLYFVILFVS